MSERVVGDIGGRFYRPDSLDEVPRVWDFHLGYTVHPAWWGRGIASAAVGLFTPLLHERFGVRRIVAKVFEGNRASEPRGRGANSVTARFQDPLRSAPPSA